MEHRNNVLDLRSRGAWIALACVIEQDTFSLLLSKCNCSKLRRRPDMTENLLTI